MRRDSSSVLGLSNIYVAEAILFGTMTSITLKYSLVLWSVLFVGLIIISTTTSIALPQGKVGVVAELTSTIDGGAVEVVSRAVSEAVSRSSILILYIDSYGGYLAAADSIIKIVMESGVTTYVYIPPGGKAASAGSLIALLGRRVFMGEASTIGAAQPSPSDEKTVNYVAARFRSLAIIAFKGNETLVRVAEEFVTKNRVLSAAEAVALGFAEPANSLEEVKQRLGLDELVVVGYTAWNHLISVFSAPIVSSIALMVGIALIFVEFVQAGFQGYAIAGVILILISLYAMSVVPVSFFALSLLVLGLILLLIEILTPGFGAFGITGLILMFVGVYEIITSESFGIPSTLPLAAATGFAMLGGLMIYIGYEAGKARRLKTKTLREKLVGEVGVSKTRLTRETPGVVYVLGEDWTAYSVDEVIEPGTKVRVTDVKGLTLYVSKIGESTNESRAKLQES
ncbi:MAG: NfeD family protein [Zestosphaera sp.]